MTLQTMTHPLWRRLKAIALLWPPLLLLGAMTFFAPGARSGSEPAEPLPVAWSANPPPATQAGGGYVGAQTCAQCHQAEHQRWQSSQHAQAMQPATEQTVLGDFKGASFAYAGVTSTFFRRDGKFMARTDGPDGTLQDYAIAYTFGVYPLQQYLIGFPDGRYQALGIAWDSRPKAQGGQRWFHLYPGQNLTHKDPLHWTGAQQNWNYMCAECHSTNLHKNYDARLRRFNTTWSEISVSCEACHGPGANHLTWAKKEGDWQKFDSAKGLAIALDERRGITWNLVPDAGVAQRSAPRSSSRELELCARCHSRRGQFWDDYVFGKPLLDTHRLALLTPDLYYPDGQMKDEVFNHGSFLQSKMQAKGVSCSDCHDPHSGQLRASGGKLCLQCHMPAKYDTPQHHFHPAHSKGADCVACHAPATTYMGVDSRHDHSFRIPRPDLSVTLGVPNACTQCHSDKPAQWAADQAQKWYGKISMGYQHFAEALHAGNTDAVGAPELLRALLKNTDQPAIARASAVSRLGDRLNSAAFEIIRPLLTDPDPLLRSTAVRALDALPPELKLRQLLPLLNDPVRLVRIEAARALAAAPPESLNETQRLAVQRGIAEYAAAEMTSADRPESFLNIGLIYVDQRQFEQAETAYRAALDLQPTFTQAAVNLADLYRIQGRDADGEKTLRQALALEPQTAAAHHALGLLLIRQKRLPEAIAALAEAARLDGNHAGYGYVYAVALNSAGQGSKAIQELETVLQRHPNDRDSLFALAAFQRDAGNTEAARNYARRLAELEPDNPQAQALLQQTGAIK
ncbi:MAG: tetratricopeptide repeat protein [Candidatus Competibacter sp.]|nr:tetratricopeptide repeat protein [Candidatus Competibacter sp.]MDG4605762.1 multiheme c-type cytochrome [Candidatus Contendobacter sp.]HRD50712.1 multiheme c-type cytochrome [Candidatus Contendobacter sp.]